MLKAFYVQFFTNENVFFGITCVFASNHSNNKINENLFSNAILFSRSKTFESELVERCDVIPTKFNRSFYWIVVRQCWQWTLTHCSEKLILDFTDFDAIYHFSKDFLWIFDHNLIFIHIIIWFRIKFCLLYIVICMCAFVLSSLLLVFIYILFF